MWQSVSIVEQLDLNANLFSLLGLHTFYSTLSILQNWKSICKELWNEGDVDSPKRGKLFL